MNFLLAKIWLTCAALTLIFCVIGMVIDISGFVSEGAGKALRLSAVFLIVLFVIFTEMFAVFSILTMKP